MALILLALAVACLVAAVARRVPDTRVPRAWSRVPEHRFAPVVVGLLSALLLLFAWSASGFMPVDHDEVAYLLQSRIFSMGHWSSPAPPLPEFFGQAHVLVTPVLASKYPPGHSLLLTLGALVGAPVAVVFVLNVVRFGLIFSLARRLTDGATALLTSVLLLLGNDQRRFSASYYSEVTSGALLVVAWFCLWRWHDGRRRGWLLGLAASLGWIAITRPWSALAFAFPIAFVVLRDLWRARAARPWRELVLALVVGSCIVGIIPLWAHETLGGWLRTPQVEYTRDYMPFDFPHFGTVAARPRLTPPPDVAAINVSLRAVEKAHTIGNIGHDAAARASALVRDTFRGAFLVFLAVVVLGVIVMPGAAWVGVATLVLTFIGYLAHPTWQAWTVYYFEVQPVLVFLAALGFAAVWRMLAGEWKQTEPSTPAPRARIATAVACLCLAPSVVNAASQLGGALRIATQERRDFEQAVAKLPHQPAIVFIHYGPQHSSHRSLTVNRADWRHAPAWLVYDMGAHDEDLMRLAPARHAYLYDEARQQFLDVQP